MADVPAPNYPTPNWDAFGATIGDLGNTYLRGVQNKMLLDQQRAFQNGLPMTPQGQPDYARIMQTLASKGDINSIASIGPLLQDQQLLNQGSVVSPMFSGASYAPGTSPAPASPRPTGDIPPASAAAGAPSAVRGNVTVDSGSDAASSPSMAPTTGSVYTIAQAVVPDARQRAKASDFVERALGVQPGEVLTGEQAARAARILANFARAGGAAAPTDSDYAEPVKPGVRPPGDQRFADQAQDLQQDAGDLGIPSVMTSGQRSSQEQAYLRREREAGRSPYPAARPGESPHEQGTAADIVAMDRAQQPDLIALARSRGNFRVGADFGDPVHFEARGAQVAQAGPAPAAAAGGPIVPQVPLPHGYTDPQRAILALDQEIARLSPNRYWQGQVQSLRDWRDRIAASTAPMEVRPGQTIVDPRDGSIRFQAPMTSPNAVAMERFIAENPNATAADIQAFQRAGQAPRSGVGMYIQRVLEQNPNATAADISRAMQEYQGGNAGATLLGRRAAGFELAENEAASLIPAVKAASAAVNRTQYPNLNAVIIAARQGTGDENVIRLGVAVESLTQAYARALSPTGAPLASDKAHAHDLLDKAWSQGQVEAALDQMQIEIDRARASLQKTMRDRKAGGLDEEPLSSPPGPTTPVAPRGAPTGGGIPSGWSVEVH